MPHRHDRESVGFDSWAQMDVLLPEQLHSRAPGRGDPERRLRLAVLEDAIRDMQRYVGATSRRERALYDDALAWFLTDDRAETFSFQNVCDALDLDAEYIRGGLSRWRSELCAGSGAPSRLLPRFVSRRVQPQPRVHRRRAA